MFTFNGPSWDESNVDEGETSWDESDVDEGVFLRLRCDEFSDAIADAQGACSPRPHPLAARMPLLAFNNPWHHPSSERPLQLRTLPPALNVPSSSL